MRLCVTSPTPADLASLRSAGHSLRIPYRLDHLFDGTRLLTAPADALGGTPSDLCLVPEGLAPNTKRLPRNPAELWTLGRCVAQLAQRYPGRTWELFNEPDGFLLDADPAGLVACFKAVREAWKSAGIVDARLIGPSLGDRDLDGDTRALVAGGLQDHIDFWTIHPYHDARLYSPEAWVHIESRRLKAAGVARPLAVTEVGYRRDRLPLAPVSRMCERLTGFETRAYVKPGVSSGFYLRSTSEPPRGAVVSVARVWADAPTFVSFGTDDASGRTELVDATPRVLEWVGVPTATRGVWRGCQAYAPGGETIRWDQARVYPLTQDVSAPLAYETQADLLRRCEAAWRGQGVEVFCAFEATESLLHPGYGLTRDGKALAVAGLSSQGADGAQ